MGNQVNLQFAGDSPGGSRIIGDDIQDSTGL